MDSSWSSDITNCLDSNIRIIRWATIALPSLGAGILLCKHGYFKRYTQWKDVGTTHHFSAFISHLESQKFRWQLYCYHVPFLERASGLHFRSYVPASKCLLGRLAFITPVDSPEARLFARRRLLHRFVRAEPVHIRIASEMYPYVPVRVFRGFGWWRQDVGLELVRKGHATISTSFINQLVTSTEKEQSRIEIRRVSEQYQQAQDMAEFRGRGVWTRQGSMLTRISAFSRLVRAFWCSYRYGKNASATAQRNISDMTQH